MVSFNPIYGVKATVDVLASSDDHYGIRTLYYNGYMCLPAGKEMRALNSHELQKVNAFLDANTRLH